MRKFLLILFSIIAVNYTFSQCVITATVVDSTFDCNDSIEISLIGFADNPLSENFNCPGGPCDPSWQSVGGAQFDNPYDVVTPSPSGDQYFWMGPSATLPKTLTSGTYNISGSVQICFDMVYAGGNNGSPIEALDEYHEGVGVQYNNGSGWVDIIYWSPQGDTLPANPIVNGNVPSTTTGPFTTWHNFCIDVPAAAAGPNTQFRWIQEETSGATVDHWGLDNISINVSSPDYRIIFNNNGSLVGSSPNSVMVAPTSDSLFTFTYIDVFGITGESCSTSLQLSVNPTDAGPDVTVSCSTLGIPLELTGVNQNQGSVVWSPSIGLDDVNSFTPYANPTDDQMYTVTSDCGIDSTFVNVVPIFEAYANVVNDSICVNDTTVLLATSNEPSVVYTYEWTNFVANGSVANPTVSPTINTMYYLEMVSDSGCVRNDSVQVFVGAIPKTINYLGELRVCAGDSTQITVEAIQPTFFDDFDNNGPNMSIWSDIQNGTANTDCGSVSGDALHFNDGPNRWAQLIPVDASLGGTISFDLIYGSSGGACSFVGFFDDMFLEYSIDNGVSWTTMVTYAGNYNTFTSISDTIIIGAQTPNTIFRFNQPSNGGTNTDNWAIDNFLLEINCVGSTCGNFTYSWTPTATVSDPTSINPFFFPSVTTDYSLSISPEGFSCNSAADIITIEVDELDINISPSDTFLCEPTTILLDATIGNFTSTFDGVYIVEEVTSSAGMITPPATATSISLGDDQVSPAISIPFGFDFFGDTYSSFTISSNGFISFTNTNASGCCAGQVLPNPATPNAVIALLWSDLDPGGGAGTISHFVTGTAPNQVMVIEFLNVPHFPGGTAPTISGQIQLFQGSNAVNIVCSDCQTDNGSNQTLGMENADGTIGWAPPAYNGVPGWSLTNQSWSFIPSNSPALFNFGWTPNIALTDDSIINPLASPTSSTDYVLNVYNFNNCLFKDTAKIEIFEPNTTITATPNPVCEGETVQLNATGADSYTWTPATALSATNIANPVSSTTERRVYHVEYNTQGCLSSDSIRIDVLDLPEREINNGTDPVEFCEGFEAKLTVENQTGWTFDWTGPETGTTNSIDVSTPGNYTVTFNDGNCSDSRTVTVAPANEKPVFDFSNLRTVLCCYDDSSRIQISSVVTNSVGIKDVYWNGLITTNAVEYVTSNSAGNNITNELNILRVVTDKGCETESPLPQITTRCANPVFTGPDTVFFGTTEVFDLSVEETNATNTTYAWTTNQDNSIIEPAAEDAGVKGLTEGVYDINVSVTNTYPGKSGTCTEVAEGKKYEVVVIEDPQYPDAFTPKNGDEVNNVFRPVISRFATIKEFRVYNRWGQLVYDMSTAENKEGWDGTWNDQDQEAELYIYYMNIEHPDNDFIKQGSVTLIR